MTSLVYELTRKYDSVAEATDISGMSDMMSKKKDELKTTIPNRGDELWTDSVSVDVDSLSLFRTGRKHIGRRISRQASYLALPVALDWLNPTAFTPHDIEQNQYVWIETSGGYE